MKNIILTSVSSDTSCYHCGDNIGSSKIEVENKKFCCQGCKTVYQLLKENNLSNYYKLEKNPGLNPEKSSARFEYLDNKEIQDQLLSFQDKKMGKIILHLPQIHCSSCIWLLENLARINKGIQSSRVNFLKKEATIQYKKDAISLKEVVLLLCNIGYPPEINLANSKKESNRKKVDHQLLFELGVAGFGFGNIMLLSLPEYLGFDSSSLKHLAPFFGYVNLVLGIIVGTYSGKGYFKSAYFGIKYKSLNIDVPISLGILVLLIQSSFEIITHTGSGYFDSLAGLLFFLLLGKLFQQKTYNQLSFDRDFKSYFPIGATLLKDNKEISIPISQLSQGNRILIRNNEIIPVDSLLISQSAQIDNSFVTGESTQQSYVYADKIYAGGKLVGKAIEVEVIKEVSNSYLTNLWNNEVFQKESQGDFKNLTDRISQYFTPIILLVGIAAFLFHLQFGFGNAIQVLSSVLIVACPCALALSAPFTLGNGLRLLAKVKVFVKDAVTIEKLALIKHLVFDKTGTLTKQSEQKINYYGKELTAFESRLIGSLLRNSNHPLSKSILKEIKDFEAIDLDEFEEIPGSGLKASFEDLRLRIGSANFVGTITPKETRVYIQVNKEIRGYFEFKNVYRNGIEELTSQLANKYDMTVLTGDHEGEKEALNNMFNGDADLRFNQRPEDKLKAIKSIQMNKSTLMIGDGLNDAGALKQADVGISLAEDSNSFTPSSDVIMDAERLINLNQILDFSIASKRIILASFSISFLYNLIGLSFAVTGHLSPITAAILMPLSSITVVLFATISSSIAFKNTFKANFKMFKFL